MNAYVRKWEAVADNIVGTLGLPVLYSVSPGKSKENIGIIVYNNIKNNIKK